jgi:two-component system sensor histidine kinase YesM
MPNNKFLKRISSLSIDKKLLAVAILAVSIFMVVFESVQFVYMKDYVLSQREYSMEKTHSLSSDVMEKIIASHVEAMDYLCTNDAIEDFVKLDMDFGSDVDQNHEFYMAYEQFRNVIESTESNYGELDNISTYTMHGYMYNGTTRKAFSNEKLFNTKWYKYMTDNNVDMLWCDDSYLSSHEKSGEGMIHYIRYIHSNLNYNRPVGIIRLSFNKNRLLAIIKSRDENNISFLKNSRGEIIACSEKDLNLTFASEITDNCQHYDNVCYSHKYDGNEYLAISDTINYADWTFVNAVNIDEILSSYLIRTAFIIGIMLAIFALVVFLMVLSWRAVTRRLTAFIDAINSTSLDNLKEVDANSADDDLGLCIKSYNSMIKRTQLLLAEKAEARKKIQKIEMDFLYEQINPHFLFNTLSIINALAIEHKNYDIVDSLEQISRYYRIHLKNTELQISLRDEIEHLKLYVAISNKRFRKHIKFEYDVPEELMEFKVLKMLMQPAVENSILHGFANENDDGQHSIYLVAYQRGKYVYIELMDNGCGIPKEKLADLLDPDKNDRIGLANTEKRIKLYYGENCGIKIDSVEGEYTRVLYTLLDNPNDEI